MSAGTALLKFFQFVAEAAPAVAEAIRGLMGDFWRKNIHDLGPVPPDVSGFDAVDARIDERLKK